MSSSKIDRSLQRKLLPAMSDAYPERIRNAPEGVDQNGPAFCSNLLYLEEHGLCESGISARFGSHGWIGSKITAKGLDFLEEDGGLSAILGVVTVRLHSDTIRDLLEAKIDDTFLSEPEKSALKQRLSSLGGTALTTATTELVKQGLEHLPNAVVWLQKLAGL